MKKFKVASGKIKECIQDEKGNWVTAKKGWLVAHKNGTLLAGCSEYHEKVSVDEDTLPQNDSTWTIPKIKVFMDGLDINYNSGDTKLDLVNKTRLYYNLQPLSQ